mgnify:FL=1|tara:strand:+ start:387 stop:767 length:381 start_codon:yes stop_codon:yes gene_type:complete
MKAAIFILWALFAFAPTAEAVNPNVFKGVVSLQVLCSHGGPEIIMKELLDGYNEKPVHALDVSTPTGLNIQMYITENKNNPSSTVLMHNQSPGVNKTCIFWSANDYLRTLETESLPAKSPEGKTGV